MKIDQDLRDQIVETPEATALVVLCCKASAKVSAEELDRYGFKFEEQQTVEDECFIYGKIKLKDIEKLSAVAAVEAVSSAPEMRIC